MNGGVGDRLKALRDALGWTQPEVAARSGGNLKNYRDVLNHERERLKATTDRVRAGYAQAFGVSRDIIAEYIDGRVSLEHVLAARSKRAEVAETSAMSLRRHPNWQGILAEAKRLKPLIDPEVFERLADQPFVWGPLDAVDGPLLAGLASSLEDWEARLAQRPPASSRRER